MLPSVGRWEPGRFALDHGFSLGRDASTMPVELWKEFADEDIPES